MKTILILLILLVGQIRAEVVLIEPLRKPANDSTLADVESHTEDSYIVGGQKVVYKDPDPVTSTHEQIHCINSLLRKKYKVQCAFYLLKNKAYLIPKHPTITLSEIAKNVEKGITYKHYIVQQQKYWDKQPLYILDECIAYLHGTKTALEIKNQRRATESFLRCVNLYNYGTKCAELSKGTKYLYQEELDDLIGVLYVRIILVKNQMESLGWLNNDHKYWLDLL